MLAFVLCCEASVNAQSGKVRQMRQPEARSRGLSGREVKARTEVAPDRRDETKATEELSRASNRRFSVRGLNEGRRAPVAHSLDPEHITFAIIMGMIIVILASGRV